MDEHKIFSTFDDLAWNDPKPEMTLIKYPK